MLPLSGRRRLCNYNGVPVVWDLRNQRDECWDLRQPENKHFFMWSKEECLPCWKSESQNCLWFITEASPPPGCTGWGRGKLSGCRQESWRSPGFLSGEGPWWWCELDLCANTHKYWILNKSKWPSHIGALFTVNCNLYKLTRTKKKPSLYRLQLAWMLAACRQWILSSSSCTACCKESRGWHRWCSGQRMPSGCVPWPAAPWRLYSHLWDTAGDADVNNHTRTQDLELRLFWVMEI